MDTFDLCVLCYYQYYIYIVNYYSVALHAVYTNGYVWFVCFVLLCCTAVENIVDCHFIKINLLLLLLLLLLYFIYSVLTGKTILLLTQ